MITQTELAKQVGVSQQLISRIMTAKGRPSWKTAKKLASITGTPPILWLEGTPAEIKAALDKAYPNEKSGQVAA